MRATSVDAKRAVTKAIPRGMSIRPSIPLRKNSGAKLTTIINVELSIGIRTSRDALYTSSIIGIRSGSGNSRF